MAKAKTQYVCGECGGTAPKWQGQCPHCSAWNTLTEARFESGNGNRFAPAAGAPARVQSLGSIQAAELPRLSTGIDEFDRVLGGGLVPGGVVLIGGDPGIGKSTLLLQALSAMADSAKSAAPRRVLYVSGEESAPQVALRARRLGIDGHEAEAGEQGDAAGGARENTRQTRRQASRGATGDVRLLAETSLDNIVAALAEEKPDVAVIDSIQTLYSGELQSAPGSVSQVRECAAQLTRTAKQSGVSLVFVGHVTKEGALAGPRVLEHMVDTVLYFEGDTHSSFRLVRAFKNRFGAVNELGVFAMTERGLRGVSNPSALFLSQHEGLVSGSCVMVTQEGTRPLLVEIQALVDSAHVPNPRRLSVGLEAQRLALLLAVLHRHGNVATFDQDVFVNAVGGVRIQEPAADLAVLAAIVSSIRNKPLPRGLVVFGEVGLAGEIRPAPRGQERLREAAKLGFSTALIPRANAPRQRIEGLEVIAVDRLEAALELFRR